MVKMFIEVMKREATGWSYVDARMNFDNMNCQGTSLYVYYFCNCNQIPLTACNIMELGGWMFFPYTQSINKFILEQHP